MSFGKDSQHLAGIPVYGGSLAQRAANAGRKKKRNYGNTRPYWADGFRPSETQVSDVRLIPGEYEITRVDEKDQLITEKCNWFEFVEHYSGRHKRGAICSGGPWFFRKDKREPCLGCDKRDSEHKNNRTMSRSDKFVFTVIDKGLFHQVQQVDRETGRVRLNKENQPYLEWVKCALRGCQHCHVALQSRYGYIQPWAMPKAHFNALNSYAPGIGTCCVTCSGRGTIQSLAWRCGNQQCGAVIFDMRTTTASDEQIGSVVNAPFGCRTCQQLFYPEEVIHCTNCANYGTRPMRATIFDVDLQVKAPRTGEGDMTVLQITGMSDPKPIDPVFQDLLQYKPDLSKRFSPTPVEQQAKLWEMNTEPQHPQQQPQGYAQPGGFAPQMQPQMQVPLQTYTQPYGQAPLQQPMAQPPAPQYPQAPQMPMGPPAGAPHFVTGMQTVGQGYPPQPQQPQLGQPQYAPQQQPYVNQQPMVQPPTMPQGGYLPPVGR